MKKAIIITVLLLALFLFNGCYADQKRKDMDLTIVKVFDSEGQEIIGTIEYEYDIKNLNSALPEKNFYKVLIQKDEEYTVKFYFKSEHNKQLKSINLSDMNEEFIMNVDNVKDSSLEETNYVVTFTVSNLETNSLYEVTSWFDDENNENTFGFVANNVYLRGVFFSLGDIAEESCIF